MKCPKCGCETCHIISQTYTSGKDYSASKGCLGTIIFGPTGLLCGLCGEGKETYSKNYWICSNCGKKWKA